MKKLLILGAGTAGTMMLNKLRHRLDKKEWEITIVENDPNHYYQPGFLFVPFGIYSKTEIVKPKADFFPNHIHAVWDEVVKIEPENNQVLLKNNEPLAYDVLLIATGCTPDPAETPGLKGELWEKDIFTFYTYEGSCALHDKLENWEGGKLVINIVDMPIKCPPAPLEFTFLAEAFFTNKGMRDKVDITFVTPMSGPFTKPVASKMLSGLLAERNVHSVNDFYIERVDEANKKIVSYDEKEVPFDLLITIPTNKGAAMVAASGLDEGDDLNFAVTDKHTLQSKQFENIFVIGDATNLPASKAGSVAHFEGEILTENIMEFIAGKPLTHQFDGHSNCFIETGYGQASVIDFNYEVQPLPGKFPVPGIGPLSLLGISRINHWGKLAFKWAYWNMLLKGIPFPISTNMSMAGKEEEAATEA
jgi:sulfide:quinone oxidoreductase